MKLYKYIYKGTTSLTVLKQTVRKPGDSMEIPFNNFKHKNFISADGGMNYPKNIMKLKNKLKGNKCLLIGRGESSESFNYDDYNKHIRIAVNPSKKVIKKAHPDYIVYLENNYSDFINDNLDLFKDIIVIGNELALNCDKVDYCYGREEVIEGKSSGNYAVQIAILLGMKDLSFIGYDYYGKEYEDDRLNVWLDDIKGVMYKLDKVKLNQLNKKSLLIFEGVE